MSEATSTLPDWRDAERYRALLGADLATWAWEFGRRAGDGVQGPDGLCFAGPGPAADPTPAVIWRAEVDLAMPSVIAAPAMPDDPAALDLKTLDLPVIVIQSASGQQHVLVCDGANRLRYSIVEGDGLAGPAKLAMPLPALGAGAASLASLRALIHLRDSGRLPKGSVRDGGRARRWADALRAHDARRDGASQREIAVLLYGAARVAADWASASDYMRMRVQRLVRGAETMVAGGYRAMFGLNGVRADIDPPATIWTSPRWNRSCAGEERG